MELILLIAIMVLFARLRGLRKELRDAGVLPHDSKPDNGPVGVVIVVAAVIAVLFLLASSGHLPPQLQP